MAGCHILLATPIERGAHALASGLSVRAYAEKVGRPVGSVQHEREAAKVAACSHVATDLDYKTLVAIHAAPGWMGNSRVADGPAR